MESQMTQVLAAVGTVTGVIGLALNLLSFRRNRPKLMIKSLTEFSHDKRVFAKLEVRNEGLQPVDIVGIGVAISTVAGRAGRPLVSRILFYLIDFLRGERARPHDVKYNELAEEDGEEQIVHLTPGKRQVIKIPMETIVSRTSENRYAWPYVEDFGGRIVYAKQPAHIQQNRDTLVAP
jgi:hypothetical protein